MKQAIGKHVISFFEKLHILKKKNGVNNKNEKSKKPDIFGGVSRP